MSDRAEALRESSARARGAWAFPTIRLLEWSVRRELWENRSITIAPLSVAAIMLFAASIGTMTLPRRRAAILLLDPERQRAAMEKPYDMVAMAILFTALLVGIFYCLDALHGERRDRSILFWKSLPVSDTVTVIAKACVPLLILPLFSFAIIVAVHLVLLLLSSAVLAGSGLSSAAAWPQWSVFPSPAWMLTAVAMTALWHAPLYAWLLLVSGWARRAAFLWAFLPFMVLSMFERGAFKTSYIGAFLRHRMLGWWEQAFVPVGRGHVALRPLTEVSLGELLLTPGLWVGLAFAAAFLAIAVRLRRYRDPI